MNQGGNLWYPFGTLNAPDSWVRHIVYQWGMEWVTLYTNGAWNGSHCIPMGHGMGHIVYQWGMEWVTLYTNGAWNGSHCIPMGHGMGHIVYQWGMEWVTLYTNGAWNGSHSYQWGMEWVTLYTNGAWNGSHWNALEVVHQGTLSDRFGPRAVRFRSIQAPLWCGWYVWVQHGYSTVLDLNATRERPVKATR